MGVGVGCGNLQFSCPRVLVSDDDVKGQGELLNNVAKSHD